MYKCQSDYYLDVIKSIPSEMLNNLENMNKVVNTIPVKAVKLEIGVDVSWMLQYLDNEYCINCCKHLYLKLDNFKNPSHSDYSHTTTAGFKKDVIILNFKLLDDNNNPIELSIGNTTNYKCVVPVLPKIIKWILKCSKNKKYMDRFFNCDLDSQCELGMYFED